MVVLATINTTSIALHCGHLNAAAQHWATPLYRPTEPILILFLVLGTWQLPNFQCPCASGKVVQDLGQPRALLATNDEDVQVLPASILLVYNI